VHGVQRSGNDPLQDVQRHGVRHQVDSPEETRPRRRGVGGDSSALLLYFRSVDVFRLDESRARRRRAFRRPSRAPLTRITAPSSLERRSTHPPTETTLLTVTRSAGSLPRASPRS
jgi:hypothetical protein